MLSGIIDFAKANPSLVGGLLGAALGGEDQTTSSQRDPWAPAQPLLKDFIGRTAQLNDFYQRNPFSPQQQQAYGNLFGLLNTANASAPGMLAGFNANATGANNYDRRNKTKPLQGGQAMSLGPMASMMPDWTYGPGPYKGGA